MYSSGVLRANIKQMMPGTGCARQRIAHDVLLQRLVYQKPVSSISVARDMVLMEKKEEISHSQPKRLERVAGSEKLKSPCCRTCANVSLLSFKECEHE